MVASHPPIHIYSRTHSLTHARSLARSLASARSRPHARGGASLSGPSALFLFLIFFFLHFFFFSVFKIKFFVGRAPPLPHLPPSVPPSLLPSLPFSRTPLEFWMNCRGVANKCEKKAEARGSASARRPGERRLGRSCGRRWRGRPCRVCPRCCCCCYSCNVSSRATTTRISFIFIFFGTDCGSVIALFLIQLFPF